MKSLFVNICFALALAAPAIASNAATKVIETFNYVVGTQTFGARYKFTEQPKIVETAQAILDMGSNILKFGMSDRYSGDLGNVPTALDSVKSLTDLAKNEPAHKKVLDMPFAYYIIWVYPFAPCNWYDGMSEEEKNSQYKEMYQFVCYLLQTYNGSGKTFYLGHWEGDWHLRPTYDMKSTISDTAVQGMIGWLNIRQKAVDDAKRDTKHKNVQVYNYTEVNLVKIGMDGAGCLTNSVLPKTNVDYVSYSSYDTEWDTTQLKAALSYIESKLTPKTSIKGKRVFIGEYGFPASSSSPEKQASQSNTVMQAGLEWGCPFVLYWEMYNNEEKAVTGNSGFWMIDDKGEKQPVYYLHKKFYEWAKGYTADISKRTGKLPSAFGFGKAGAKFLKDLQSH